MEKNNDDDLLRFLGQYDTNTEVVDSKDFDIILPLDNNTDDSSLGGVKRKSSDSLEPSTSKKFKPQEKKQTVLSKLLQTGSTGYNNDVIQVGSSLLPLPGPSSSSPGLSSRATQLPSTDSSTRLSFLQENKHNYVPLRERILPKLAPKPSSTVTSDHSSQNQPKQMPTLGQALTTDDDKSAARINHLKLMLVANIEFDITKYFNKKHKMTAMSMRRHYTIIVFEHCCLLVSDKQERVRNAFLDKPLEQLHTSIWRKQDKSRKTYDTILFPNLNFQVGKPGKGQAVFDLIEKSEPFFLESRQLWQVFELYKRMLKSLLVSRINFLRHLNCDTANVDIKKFIALKTYFDQRIVRNTLEDLKNVMKKPRGPSYECIKCKKCGKLFTLASDFLYHRFLCRLPKHPVKPEKHEFDLLNQLSAVTNKSINKSCSSCNLQFFNPTLLNLHQDDHLKCGHLYPCYSCSRIFLTPWSFTKHKCNQTVVLETRLDVGFKLGIDNVELVYTQVSQEVSGKILKCPVCQKQHKFFSQLLRYGLNNINLDNLMKISNFQSSSRWQQVS